jgi:hypothetical protein
VPQYLPLQVAIRLFRLGPYYHDPFGMNLILFQNDQWFLLHPQELRGFRLVGLPLGPA